MADRNAFKWFKTTFHNEIEQALVGTPFSLDLIAAIAAQETGHIWGPLHDKLEVEQLLEICVGDTLDADGGRRAFPKLKADLLAVTRGDEMFRIAHEALVAMAEHVPSFTKVAKRPDKFCHGYGIFQYDIQFFRTNPDYFLTREWRRFTSSLEQCIEELRSALKRVEGTRGKTALSDLEQAHVAIACNTGSFKPAKGLKQGFFDGSKFYGEMIFDFLRLSETVSIPELPARLPEAPPGTAPIARPMPVRAEGPVLQVDVRDAPLRLRSKPFVDRQDPNANVIARLPDGQLVRLVAGTLGDKFVEVETSLNGAHFRGFAASEFLIAASDTAEVRVAVPAAAPPTSGIVAVFGPARPGVVTRRANPASAQSLNEPGQPGRRGTTPEELRGKSTRLSITSPWTSPLMCAINRATATPSATSTRTTTAFSPASTFRASGGRRTRLNGSRAASRSSHAWEIRSMSNVPTTCFGGCVRSACDSDGARRVRSPSCKRKRTSERWR